MEPPGCCLARLLQLALVAALAVALALALGVQLTAAGCARRIVHEAQLPADWPIPQLTLPNDIELKAGPEAMHKVDPAEPDKSWVVAFNKDDNWPAFIAHVEGCLKPLGYFRSKSTGSDNPLGLDLPEMRTYYAPDFKTEVLITHGAYFDALGPRDIEFALKITVYEEPPDYLKTLIKHPNPAIGPKELEQIRSAVMEPIT